MNEPYRVLSLFAGIGGFDLGLERTGGFKTVAFCEIEDYPRRVLKKHWPDVPQYEDVRTLTADTLRRDGIGVDVIVGGFPCQDLSYAGKRAGLEGERSGLWGEYRRLIGELQPRWVIAENVPGLLTLGMGRVLGDLSALGYSATWDCIPASAVGAPHQRDRVWIIAHPNKYTGQPRRQDHAKQGTRGRDSGGGDIRANEMADATGERRGEERRLRRDKSAERTSGSGETLANTDHPRLEGRNGDGLPERAGEWTARPSSPLGNAPCELPYRTRPGTEQDGRREPSDPSWWLSES